MFRQGGSRSCEFELVQLLRGKGQMVGRTRDIDIPPKSSVHRDGEWVKAGSGCAVETDEGGRIASPSVNNPLYPGASQNTLSAAVQMEKPY